MGSSFQYTYRCPDCKREKVTFELAARMHEGCLDAPKTGQSYLVLVAVDGDDVSHHSDPEPLVEKPKRKRKTVKS